MMQNTSHLLMIKPVNFGFNAETAVNNSFQKKPAGDIQQQALQEFNNFVDLLRSNKVDVTVVEDSPQPATPDSIFPNNWISFHGDGTVFLYPMFAVNRRLERKDSVLGAIKQKFIVETIIDLSHYEKANLFLEGTGSMILDRANKIVYACLSPRTDATLLHEFCAALNYTAVSFQATDGNAVDIYHTNVMMCLADEYAVICLASITNENERKKVIDSLKNTGKEILEITAAQLNHFAGNMLQVKNADGVLLLVMSTQSYNSLDGEQITKLQAYNQIVHSPLNTIEAAGGGSARCMMAEVFLPLK